MSEIGGVMELNKDNYFGPEAQRQYMSVSQFKTFLECPERMLAELNGIYRRQPSKDMLMGSYIDAALTDDIGRFEIEHPEIFRKDGGLKSEFAHCNRILERVRIEPFFLEHVIAPVQQKILTGWIAGHEWKIKVDALHEDKIVDLKVMRDFKAIWKDGERKTWIDAWGYPLQGYVYREIVRQHVGKELPFYLAAVSKEEEPDLEVIEIPAWRLDQEKAIVEHYIEEYAAVKEERMVPRRCGRCAWCRRSKTLEAPKLYEDLLKEMEE